MANTESNNYFDEVSFTDESFHQSFVVTPSEFINCTFNGVDFSHSELQSSKFIDCVFLQCNLNNILLANVVFIGAEFKKSRMMGLNWSRAKTLASLSFVECQLDYSVFQSLSLVAVNFTNCSLKEVDFYETNLSKAIFTDSLLTQAAFNKTNLSEADFRGARDYYIDSSLCNVKKAKFNMPEAMALLKSLGIIIE